MNTKTRRDGRRRIAFMVNRGKPLAAKLVPQLVRWLRAAGHEPLLSTGTHYL